MKKTLKEYSLLDLSQRNDLDLASDTTRKFSIERRGIMGDSPKSTKLISSKIDYEKDYITYYFLTEATEKYSVDHVYKDVRPDMGFALERDPSATYEIWMRFYGVSKLTALRGGVKEALGDENPDLNQGIAQQAYGEQPEPIDPNLEAPEALNQPLNNTQQVEPALGPQEINQDQPAEQQSEPVLKASHTPEQIPTKLDLKSVKAFLWTCDQMQLWSNSPSFHWQGFNFHLSQVNASIFPTNIPDTKWRNIHGDVAALDKHLLDLMVHIRFFLNQMASSLLNKIRTQRESAIMSTIDLNIPLKEEALLEYAPNHQDMEIWINFQKGVAKVYRLSLAENKYFEPKDIVDFTKKQVMSEDNDALLRLAFQAIGSSPHTQEVLTPALSKAVETIKAIYTNPQKYKGINKDTPISTQNPNGVDVRIKVYEDPKQGKKAGEVVFANKTKLMQEKFFNPDIVEKYASKLSWSENPYTGDSFKFKAGEGTYSGLFYADSGTLETILLARDSQANKFKYIFNIDISDKLRIDTAKVSSEIKEYDFTFTDENESIKMNGAGNVGEVFKCVLTGAITFVKKENPEILVFFADNDSISRAHWYYRLSKEVLEYEKGSYVMLQANNIYGGSTYFFLIRKDIYNKLFQTEMIHEAITNEKAVCTIGTYSPITSDHLTLLKKVYESAKKEQATPITFLVDNKDHTNTEFARQNISLVIRKEFPEMKVVSDENVNDIGQAMMWAYNSHYTEIFILVAADQYAEIDAFMKEHNGRKDNEYYFKFENYKVVSSGLPNPDMSTRAQKARNDILNNKLSDYMKTTGIPEYDNAKQIFNIMRHSLSNAIGV